MPTEKLPEPNVDVTNIFTARPGASLDKEAIHVNSKVRPGLLFQVFILLVVITVAVWLVLHGFAASSSPVKPTAISGVSLDVTHTPSYSASFTPVAFVVVSPTSSRASASPDIVFKVVTATPPPSTQTPIYIYITSSPVSSAVQFSPNLTISVKSFWPSGGWKKDARTILGLDPALFDGVGLDCPYPLPLGVSIRTDTGKIYRCIDRLSARCDNICSVILYSSTPVQSVVDVIVVNYSVNGLYSPTPKEVIK